MALPCFLVSYLVSRPSGRPARHAVDARTSGRCVTMIWPVEEGNQRTSLGTTDRLDSRVISLFYCEWIIYRMALRSFTTYLLIRRKTMKMDQIVVYSEIARWLVRFTTSWFNTFNFSGRDKHRRHRHIWRWRLLTWGLWWWWWLTGTWKGGRNSWPWPDMCKQCGVQALLRLFTGLFLF